MPPWDTYAKKYAIPHGNAIARSTRDRHTDCKAVRAESSHRHANGRTVIDSQVTIGQTMRGSNPHDFLQLEESDFLAERARVRELLEHQPANSVGQAQLEQVYAAMTEEFVRRARIAWHRDAPSPDKGKPVTESNEFSRLDDSALLSRRAEMRAELERLPPASPAHAALTALYDQSTEEVSTRASRAWSRPN